MSSEFSYSSEYLADRKLVIDWLIKSNFPPLPVAPAFDAREYPKIVSPGSDSATGLHCPLTSDLQPVPLYTGKNPSYLDAVGQPHLVVHSDFQTRMPTSSELKSWFVHPHTGVGTLGGWNDTIWLDFDQKRFPVDSCDDAVLRVVTAIRDRTNREPFLERTHSGGWRIGVRVAQKPNFTNFALLPGGQHAGEALGKGRFTVLAPTVGPSGNPYESVNKGELPLVESLESIGIFPVSNRHQKALQSKPSTAATLADARGGSIDLADLLCPKSRSILDGANQIGDRSHSLTVLINELFGWHNWASRNGLTVRGLPIDFIYHAGQKLDIDYERIGRIIASVGDLSSKQPSAFYLGGDLSCWKKIYRLDRNSFHRLCPPSLQAALQSDFNLNNSKITLNQHHPVSDSGAEPSNGKRQVKLVDCVKSVILAYDNEARQTEALMELAVSAGKPYSDVAHLARLIRSELESEEELTSAISSLRPLLSHCRKRLDIRRYLVAPLADALLCAAAAMPTAPEYLLNTLIPVSASRIGTSSRIVINPHGGYVQPCIFWSANVANSGQAKTPPQSLIVDPLEDLDQDDRDGYQQELADWQASTDKNKGPKPTETRRILNNTTTAQKIRIHSENPRGLLEYLDELTGDFERHNQYNGGKGDDLRHELGLFNGKFGAYDRGDVRLYLRRVAFSKTGTYQWDTLARLMSDQIDFIASGYLARFLLCSIVDAPERKLDLFSEPSGAPLSDFLRTLYRRLELLPERDYLLSHEAKVLFQAFNHSLVAAEIQESHFGLVLVYAKIESYAARLALWLHLVNAVALDRVPEPVISGETMRSAIELAAFYLWQHKLIYAHNAPSSKLDGIFLKVHTCALKLWAKGKALTASFAKSRINPLKSWATPKIRDKVFRVLAAAGFGRTDGDGEKLVYIPNELPPPPSSPSPHDSIFTVDDVGELGGELVDLSTPLAAEEQAFRHTVGEFDLPPISSTEEAHPTAICASLRQRQGRTQQRNAIAFHDGRNVNGAELEQIQSDSHTYANTTNGEGQTLSVSQFEEVDGSPTSAPTLGDLQAMLLACESITQLLNLRSNHKEPFNQAYRSLSPEQQARFDGLLAARYNEPIYKYLGEERTADGYSLSHGDLVRLKDSKMRVGVVSVLPLDAPACGQNYQPTQFIDVNPKRLRLVEKLYPLPVGEQLNLLASPSNSVTEADS